MLLFLFAGLGGYRNGLGVTFWLLGIVLLGFEHHRYGENWLSRKASPAFIQKSVYLVCAVSIALACWQLNRVSGGLLWPKDS